MAFTSSYPSDSTPEVQDILGTAPSGLLRYGMGVFFVFFLALFSISWFIKYPDTIVAKCVLTSDHPPAILIARSNGKISSLKIKDRQLVRPGEVLIILENTADYQDVLSVKALLRDKPIALPYPVLNRSLNLGELQDAYSGFIKSYSDYELFVSNDYYNRKIAIQNRQIYDNIKLKNNLHERIGLVARKLSLTQKRFKVEEGLFEQKVIAEMDRDNSETVLLDKKDSYLNTRSALIAVDIQIDDLKKSVLELQTEREAKEKELTLAIERHYAALKSQISAWEYKYLLVAPVGGKVTFHKFRAENQNVKVGDEVMTIVPDGKANIFFQAMLPVKGAGKVEAGQQVLVRLEDFPYQEYGFVSGEVESISLMPADETYMVQIKVPDRLVTNYHKKLPYKQGIGGEAEIITRNMRLIERLIYNLRALKK